MIDASDAVMADCRKGVDDVMTYVFGMCVVCLWDVREVFVVCLWDVREVFVVCLWCVRGFVLPSQMAC